MQVLKEFATPIYVQVITFPDLKWSVLCTVPDLEMAFYCRFLAMLLKTGLKTLKSARSYLYAR